MMHVLAFVPVLIGLGRRIVREILRCAQNDKSGLIILSAAKNLPSRAGLVILSTAKNLSSRAGLVILSAAKNLSSLSGNHQ